MANAHKPSPPRPRYQRRLPWSFGTRAHFLFEHGVVAVRSLDGTLLSPKEYMAAASGGPPFVAGSPYGKAIITSSTLGLVARSLDGNEGLNTVLNKPTGPLTYMVLMRLGGNYTSLQGVIGTFDLVGAKSGGMLEFGRTDNEFTWLNNPGTIDLTSSLGIADNRWRRIFLTRSGSSGSWNLALYADGKLNVATTTANNPDPGSDLNFSSGCCFGIGQFGNALSLGLIGGFFAEVRVWDRGLSQQEVWAYSGDPSAEFRQPRRWWWLNVGGGGGGDVTLALTGVSATGAVGSLAASSATSVSLTGVSATGAVGTLTPDGDTAIALSGVSATGMVGSFTPVADFSAALTGVAATGAVGTLTPSVEVTVPLTGVSATGAVGNLTPEVTGGEVTVALTGVSATGFVGDLTPTPELGLRGGGWIREGEEVDLKRERERLEAERAKERERENELDAGMLAAIRRGTGQEIAEEVEHGDGEARAADGDPISQTVRASLPALPVATGMVGRAAAEPGRDDRATARRKKIARQNALIIMGL